MIRGKPVDLLLKCVHMDDYVRDAADLKRAFDDVFKSYGMDEERFSRLLVSNCADRASVNMGRIKGACAH